MKKSNMIVLGAILLMGITACQSEPEWTRGEENGKVRDTVVRNGNTNSHYRYYHGGWYPVMMNGMISPYNYHSASASEIGRTGFTPSHISHSSSHSSFGTRSGGFGSSAHFSSAS